MPPPRGGREVPWMAVVSAAARRNTKKSSMRSSIVSSSEKLFPFTMNDKRSFVLSSSWELVSNLCFKWSFIEFLRNSTALLKVAFSSLNFQGNANIWELNWYTFTTSNDLSIAV